MIIYKSIFRKKTTKLYIFIVTGIFLIIGILLLNRSHYIKEGNENYEGSYITFKAPLSELDKIKKAKNVEKVSIGLSFSFTLEKVGHETSDELIIDETLKNNEMIAWEAYKNFLNTNESGSVLVSKNNKEKEFIVKDTYESSRTGNNGYYISQEAFNDLYDGKERVIYRVEILDFFKQNKTAEWIVENVNDISLEYGGDGLSFVEKSKKNAPLYTLYVLLYTVLSIGLGVIFLIILIYTIINILIDEKKNSNLLSHLGFNNKKIFLTKIIKLTLIILIPFIISSIILIPIYLLW